MIEIDERDLHPPQRLAVLRARFGLALVPLDTVPVLPGTGPGAVLYVPAWHVFDTVDGLRLILSVAEGPGWERPRTVVSVGVRPESMLGHAVFAMPGPEWLYALAARRYRAIGGTPERLYMPIQLASQTGNVTFLASAGGVPEGLGIRCVSY